VSQKKPIHLTFDHNFGKCRPIFKILLQADPNDIRYELLQGLPHDLNYVPTLPGESQNFEIAAKLLLIPSVLISFT